MKNYDPNIRWGVHTIKVTFQQWEYRGYVTYQLRGNVKGIVAFPTDAEDLYNQKFLDNNARLEDLGDDWFRMVLTDENGDETEVEDEWRYLNDSIVGVEIIEYVEEVAE